MLGASSSLNDLVPNFRRSSSQPSTQPGTDQLSGPVVGISLYPLSLKNWTLLFSGARPQAFRPYNFCVLASHTMANRSPPMPHDIGSIRPIAALVAIAASTALPPLLSTSRPTCAASGWLVATMPLAATVTDRPALPGTAVGRSAEMTNTGTTAT